MYDALQFCEFNTYQLKALPRNNRHLLFNEFENLNVRFNMDYYREI